MTGNKLRSLDEILNHLKKCIEDVSVGAFLARDISNNDSLMSDLGLDSLDYASVMLMTEDWLKINISESEVNWSKIQTVNDLALMFDGFQNAH